MKLLVYVGSVFAVVSYACIYVLNPYGLGFLYALLLCVSVSLFSPFVGLLITEKESVSAGKYQVCVAVNIYAAAASFYMLYTENAYWRLPITLTSVLVFIALALSEHGKKEKRR